MPSARRHRSSRSLFSASETRRFGRKKRHHTLLRFHGGAFLPGRRNERNGQSGSFAHQSIGKNPGHAGLFRQNTFSCARGGAGKTRKEPLPRKAANPTAPAAGFAMDSKDTEPLQTRIRRQKGLPEQAMRRQAMKGLISLSRSSQGVGVDLHGDGLAQIQAEKCPGWTWRLPHGGPRAGPHHRDNG